eukprot:scaffold66669_cov45-Attheya_sp.AAC.2
MAQFPSTTTNSVSVTVKYQRSTIRIADCARSAIAVAFLSNEAVHKWPSLLAETSFSFHVEKECSYEASDEYLNAACTYPRTVYLKTEQTGFSDLCTEDDALKEYAGVQDIEMDDEASSLFPPPCAIDDNNELLAHAVKDLELKHTLYNPIEKGCEYTRREFISSVLVLAASIAGVKLSCDKQVYGSPEKVLLIG